MKKYLRDYLFLLTLAGTIVALDQWTKNIIRTQLQFGETWVPWDWLAPYARIVYWHNSGAAFGLGQNLSILFTILPFFVIGAIIFYYPQIPKSDWPLRIALGLQLGGAIGNLIDRLTIGFVTDFISVGRFPVFNVADSSISIGVAVLIIGMWILERKQKSAQNNQGESFGNTGGAVSGEEFQGE
ncbi:MAG: signal peptidase II [Anaerolineales bacterium]|nr:signal peptidase II [Anaerolineales bacterium]